MLAVPRAKSEAIKNAAKSVGVLFGRNITRDDDNVENEEDFVHRSRDTITEALKGASDDKD